MNEWPPIAFAHLLAGTLAVSAGMAAMLLPKGARMHRLCGRVFATCMLLLCASGIYLSVTRSILFTLFLSVLALHAVLSGWAAASRAADWQRTAEHVGLVLICGNALAAAGGGMAAAASDSGVIDGLPAAAFLTVASLSALLGLLDRAWIRRTQRPPRQRTARHLSRMGFAMFIATAIFFFGNSSVLPVGLRSVPLLVAPVAAVMVLTLGWLAFVLLSGPARVRPAKAASQSTDL